MKLHRIAVILLALALLTGCSEDSKKEAAKLEQEMMGEDSGTDSGTAVVSEDTLNVTPAPMDAEAVPNEEIFTMPSQPEGSGYTVQVASCESIKYAQHLIQKYTDRGYQPYMTQIEVNGQPYYRIRIGNFAAKSDADNLKLELEDKFSLQTWIDYNN